MKTKTYGRIKDVFLLSATFASLLGFVTLLVQPSHLNKGILLGAVLGISMGVSISSND